MIEIGKVNFLKLSKRIGAEIYLSTGNASSQVLLMEPLPPGHNEAEWLSAFVYVDQGGHLAATLQQPFAQVGEIAWLKVVDVNYTGAFLDWGLKKNLLIPFSEQHQELNVGDYHLVRLFLDEQQRVVATTKINRYIQDSSPYFKVGQKVSLIITDKTDIGVKAIINHSHWGMLYQNELFKPVSKGQTLDGYIKHIREDFKIDLTLYQPSYRSEVETLADKIIAKLKANNGKLAVNDKTPPEQIYQQFGVSKKVFKQALSALFKQRKIVIEDTGIRLT